MFYSYLNTSCVYRVLYFDLNRTKYFMLQEFDVDLDLIEVFSLKTSPTCSPELNSIEHIWDINITEYQSIFNMIGLKQNQSL